MPYCNVVSPLLQFKPENLYFNLSLTTLGKPLSCLSHNYSKTFPCRNTVSWVKFYIERGQPQGRGTAKVTGSSGQRLAVYLGGRTKANRYKCKSEWTMNGPHLDVFLRAEWKGLPPHACSEGK